MIDVQTITVKTPISRSKFNFRLLNSVPSARSTGPDFRVAERFVSDQAEAPLRAILRQYFEVQYLIRSSRLKPAEDQLSFCYYRNSVRYTGRIGDSKFVHKTSYVETGDPYMVTLVRLCLTSGNGCDWYEKYFFFFSCLPTSCFS